AKPHSRGFNDEVTPCASSELSKLAHLLDLVGSELSIMTLDEARTLLGVDATASADEVRRAYLRLVKRHRPDRDPVGFQRIRRAFDLIREPRTFLLDEGAPFTIEFVASSQSEQEAPAATPPASVTANDELAERLAPLGAGQTVAGRVVGGLFTPISLEARRLGREPGHLLRGLQ